MRTMHVLSVVEMEMTARLGLKAYTSVTTHVLHLVVEMEMTARLGLKGAWILWLFIGILGRNGDDSPVGIESKKTR